MSTDADHDWLDKSVDAPTVPVGCHRSHPHENMDSTCERFTQYERENASLRAEVEMLNVRHDAVMLHAQTHADEYNALREELASLKASYESCVTAIKEELAEAKREYQDACKLVAQMHHAATGSIQGPIRGVVEDVADVVETHRMQMAAISTACFSNSRSSEPPIDKTNPYWSVAYHDVVAAVKREMEQRDRAEQAEARALVMEKDAGRYRQVQLMIHIGTDAANGRSLLRLELRCEGVNLLKGSIVGHFDSEIDAAIAGAKHD